jgi:hypothetical protein
MDWLPRPIDAGRLVANAIRPLFLAWTYIPEIPSVLGIRDRVKQKAIETLLILVVQTTIRGLL